MDTDSLAPNEVHSLINELKYFFKSTTFNIPQIGKYKKESYISGKTSNLEYKFYIYRGKIHYKYSMHLRFSNNDKHLVRLCINGTRHHNEDGSVVGKNHIHIYTLHSDNHVEDYAYDLKKFPFDPDNELDQAVEKFIKYLNIGEGGSDS